MKKHFYLPILALVLSSNLAIAQIGVNTIEPKATLDVVGNPTDNTSLDGIIAPRISAVQLKAKNYTSEQTGSLIYVNESFGTVDSNLQTRLISDVGYYMFNGTEWIPFKNTDPLYDVVNRGNYSPKFISFTGDPTTKQGSRDGAIGYNNSTKSYFFGNMNSEQTGQNNVGFGYNSLQNLTNGNGTVAVGNNSFATSTGGVGNEYNTGIGDGVGNLFKGDHSVAVGNNALSSNWAGEQNTAVGQNSMSGGIGSTKVSYNTAIGSNSLRLSNQPFGNIAIGRDVGVRSAGRNNVFIGNGLANANLYSQGFTGSNKLLIHSFEMNESGGYVLGAGTGTWNNPLIYGDFSVRWLRINGGFQLNPAYTKVATADATEILFFNKTSGDISYKPSNNFLTTSGTVAGNPITGQLEYVGGDTVGVPDTYGYYSQNDIKVSGFTIQNDGDLIPMMYVKDKATNSVVNSLEVLSEGIVTKTKFQMGNKEQISDGTDLVSKEWVEDYVRTATISVPRPPTRGSFVLEAVNGVMTWVAK